MPYISVKTTGTIPEEKKDILRVGLAKALVLIEGKKESDLMVDISENHTLYMGTKKLTAGAFVDVRFYGTPDGGKLEERKAMTEAVFRLLNKECGMEMNDMYSTIGFYTEWGLGGTLFL